MDPSIEKVRNTEIEREIFSIHDDYLVLLTTIFPIYYEPENWARYSGIGEILRAISGYHEELLATISIDINTLQTYNPPANADGDTRFGTQVNACNLICGAWQNEARFMGDYYGQ